MAIAVILDRFPTLSETFIAREIAALRAQGLEIQVFALRQSDGQTGCQGEPQAQDTTQYTSGLCGLPQVMASALYWLCRSPRRLVAAVGAGLRATPRSPLGVCRFLRRLGPGLVFARVAAAVPCCRVHAHFAYAPGDVGVIMAALLGVPFSIAVHARDIYAQPSESLQRRLLPATFIAVCTAAARDYLTASLPKIPAERYLLVHHGLIPETFPQVSGRGDMILGIGRLEEKKGFCYLIDALALLRDESVPFSCRIIGGGGLAGPLQRMVEVLDLTSRIELTGPQSQEWVKDALQKAAILVLPSVVADDGDRDGLANVILEGLASGLPVITTTAGAGGEAVHEGENGMLVPPHDSPALAAALHTLLKDTPLRQRLGAAGRRTMAEEFDVRKNVVPLLQRLSS